ncbi:MAG: FliM/FliN family flagellar motor switch protein [Candidatus Latescibacteria bacterium]|jgi:flagellar motor switch protein FliN/FliY|nr:FliM/FliN family flagellar motor switch protein [Candidatus Latescibacterota bacterium]
MPAKKRATRKPKASRPKSPSPATQLQVDLSVELGRTRVPIETLLNWREGSLLELHKESGDAADVRVNGEPFAKGEVVAVNENFGVRLVEILHAEGT